MPAERRVSPPPARSHCEHGRPASLRGAAGRGRIRDRARGAARGGPAGRALSRQGPWRSRRGRDPGDRARRAPARRAGALPVRAVPGVGLRRRGRRVPRPPRPVPARDLHEPGHGPLHRVRRGERRAAGEHVHGRASARGCGRAGRDTGAAAAPGRGAVRLGGLQPAGARPGHPARADARVRTAGQEPPPPGGGAARGDRDDPGAAAPGARAVGHRVRRGGRAARAVARAAQPRVLPHPARGAAGRAAVPRAGPSAEPRARGARALPVRVLGRRPRRHRVTPGCDRGGARAARLAGAGRAPRPQADPVGGAQLAAAGERAPRAGRHAAAAALDADGRAPACARPRRAPREVPRARRAVGPRAHDAAHLRDRDAASSAAPRSSLAARSPASSS